MYKKTQLFFWENDNLDIGNKLLLKTIISTEIQYI